MYLDTMTIEQPTVRETITYEDAYQQALEYFEGDALAARVWVSKYALKDSA